MRVEGESEAALNEYGIHKIMYIPVDLGSLLGLDLHRLLEDPLKKSDGHILFTHGRQQTTFIVIIIFSVSFQQKVTL